MGRNAAGESFLRGFLQHSAASSFYVQVEDKSHGNIFAETAKTMGRSEPIYPVTRENISTLSVPGTIFHPGPGLRDASWHRSLFGNNGWSLCGITHTTSSAAAMDAIADLLTIPVQSWDALICTSSAVKSNVEKILQAQADYLQDRLGASKFVLPQMPVIPLGIHTEDFNFKEELRRKARQRQGISGDTIVVLFMGRLSFHAKAHPLAMYQALERAAQNTGKPVTVIECGWHANDYIRDAFTQAATLAAPSVSFVTLDGRDENSRADAWASADIFCSLSDNIQETFGITPIEAMAAGLPVIVSDWDGYKDTVRHGIDGFRVPTILPQPGLGGDLAARHALGLDTYDLYCGKSCMLAAVDVSATAQAFEDLISSPDLRKSMGEEGRARARSTYDWSKIIPTYEDLWADLDERRKGVSTQSKSLAHPWPARLDPFYAFANYPTSTLTGQSLISVDAGDTIESLHEKFKALSSLAMVKFAQAKFVEEEEVLAIFASLLDGPYLAQKLVEQFPVARQPFVLRSLAWLAKLGLIGVKA